MWKRFPRDTKNWWRQNKFHTHYFKVNNFFRRVHDSNWDFKFVLITKFRMRFHFYHNHCYMTSCLFFFFSFKTNELWLAVFTWLRTEGWGNYLRDWLWIYNFSWVYVIIDWLVSIYYKKLDFQGHEIMTNLSILYTSSIE